MSKITVHQFRLYDITTDAYCESRRWATLETIERIRGEVVKNTAIEVDASVVNSEGMTERNFDPRPRTGLSLGMQ